MKASTAFCALLAIVLGAQLIDRHMKNCAMSDNYKPTHEELYSDPNEPLPGMHFSAEFVLEEYERDGAYCIRYGDADANLFDVEISVDSLTYQSVIESINSGEEMVGTLELNEGLSCHWQQVFTFIPDTENF